MGGPLDYLSIELFSLVRVIRVFRGQKKPITKQIFKFLMMALIGLMSGLTETDRLLMMNGLMFYMMSPRLLTKKTRFIFDGEWELPIISPFTADGILMI